ncbi:MAG: hypothetical protein ACAI38_22785 [Myxococcota bacterium]
MTISTRPSTAARAPIVRNSEQVAQSGASRPILEGLYAAPPRLVAEPAPSALAPAVADPREVAYQRALSAHTAAFTSWQNEHAKPYWARVSETRTERRARPWTEQHQGPFVDTHPPLYSGPPKPNRADFGLDPDPPRPTRRIADFVSAARDQGYRFDFAPQDATAAQAGAFETQFRRRYVQAALAAGFNRDQTVGVYVFETGGDGRHTELHPNSAAVGYAQLLIANSITTTVAEGQAIADRLRAQGLTAKADLVLRMRADILRANGGRPPTWEHAEGVMSATPLGRAVHAANLDLDIGPQLQITKLMKTASDYRDYSRRTNTQRELTAEILEAMNLGGPVNGFWLGHPRTAERLTVNFFLRNGYEGNPVLSELVDGERRARTAGGFMTRMSEIMHGERRTRAGTQEIMRIFDELSPPTPPAR